MTSYGGDSCPGERAAVSASSESGLAGEAVTDEGDRAAEELSGEGVGAVAISGKGTPSPVSGDRVAEVLSAEGGAVSGKGGPSPVSDDGGRTAEASGKRKRKRDLLLSLDYPCTTRFRYRRLLAFLREYWFDDTYHLAKERLLVIFHTEDLVKKVKAGLWREALRYVHNFVPVTESSRGADLLALFLHYLMAISGFADGNTMLAGIVCDWFTRIYRDPVLHKYPFFATIVGDVLFLRAEHLRNSLDWQLVRNKAAEMVKEMANETPALKDRMSYPRGQNDMYDVMPIRSRFRQRRQVKNSGQKQPTEVAQFYLQLKKRLPSSSQPETHADSAGSKWADGETLISLLDSALQAGQMVYKLGHPSQYLSKQVFPLEAALNPKVPDPVSKQGQLEYATKQAMMRWRLQESLLIRRMKERGIELRM